MNKKIGVYLHVPFCKQKCYYCDFYSRCNVLEERDQYTEALCREILNFPETKRANTVYFGGGTPNLLGSKNLLRVLETVDKKFGIEKNAEITAEVNPGDDLGEFLKEIRQGGFNRLSIGMQSSNDEELKALGRRHSFADTVKTAEYARKAGFSRYSLDLMLAIPLQTEESLQKSAEACKELGANHVSAYMLKIEEGTVFGKKKDSLLLPDEDKVCSFYRLACECLEKDGFSQYEISNFSVPGEESRHNSKYWLDEEYLGFGPAAYSYFAGKRFHYERDLSAFLKGTSPVYDEAGGDLEEFLMMRLRLTRGVERSEMARYFTEKDFDALLKKAKPYVSAGLVALSSDKIALTREGFLLSNYLIARLLPD